jgi:uncharacterized protein
MSTSLLTREDERARGELYHDDLVRCDVRQIRPGELQGDALEFSEHVHVIAGEATVTSDDGTTLELRPSVSFVARAGWRGRWDVRRTLRTVNVVWRTPWWPARPESLP